VTRSARPWLAPLVPLYRLALGARELGLRTGIVPIRRLGWPVVSIGSLSAGGAGKTPLTLAVARALTRALMQGSTHSGAGDGISSSGIAILSRGYGRRSATPARVDPQGSAADFGDEPLLLAQQAGIPVYVANERYQAGLLAEQEQAALKGHDFSRAAMRSGNENRALAPVTIHLLDDGFQHRRLHRQIDIVLLSRHDVVDRLLPSGNLREPLSALRRATILAIPAEEADLAQDLDWQGPVWRLHRRMEVPPLDGPVLAFCGIARPDQFFAGIESLGVHLAARIAFPDHHRYSSADLARLASAAKKAGAAVFLTTEKDRVRLGALAAQLPQTLPLATATLHLEIENERAMLDALLASLRAAG
jgi:tetraacyldisaccharide 4'-kinase